MKSITQFSKAVTAVAVAFVFATGLSGCDAQAVNEKQPAAAQSVKLMTLGSANEGHQRVIPAEVDANDKSELSFRLSGQLVDLPFNEGQRVETGQLIAQLDDRDLISTLNSANADLRLARIQFQRTERLFKARQVSGSDFDTAKAELDSAVAAQMIAQNQLEYSKLHAPFSGIIATRLVNNHQMVQANQAIMTIQSETDLEVSVEVPASMMVSMEEGAPFARFHPQVRFESGNLHNIDYKKHASQVTAGTQTYKVTFALKRPENLNLLPGMAAEVIFNLEENSGSQTLPITALAHSDVDSKAIVWRYHSDTEQLEAVPVEVVAVHEDGVEVKSSLSAGDNIVAAGAAFLRSDIRVTPLKWERGV